MRDNGLSVTATEYVGGGWFLCAYISWESFFGQPQHCRDLYIHWRFSPSLTCLFVQVVTKDKNVILVGLAVKCMTGLATGLRKKFASYSTLVRTNVCLHSGSVIHHIHTVGSQ